MKKPQKVSLAGSPMSGLEDDKDLPPIDRNKAEDLEPVSETQPAASEKSEDPLFPAADNNPPDRYAFVPTTGTRISNVVEAIVLGLFQMVGVTPPAPGGARNLILNEPYYNALTEEGKQFFHKLQEEAAQETAPAAQAETAPVKH